MVIPIDIDALGMVPKSLAKVAGGDRNLRTSRDHPKYNIVEVGKNTEKCPGYLSWLAIIQSPVKDHQLTLREKLA